MKYEVENEMQTISNNWVAQKLDWSISSDTLWSPRYLCVSER